MLEFDLQIPIEDGAVRAKAAFPSGCVSALSGPSGKGKTSLLMALAGLQTDVTGVIQADAVDWATLPPNQRNIGFAFQDDRLFQHMSIRDNLTWVARRCPQALSIAEQQQVLEALDLSALQDRKADVLSGGERRRASVARAITQNADWLFLDEPFAGLDEARGAALADLIDARMAARKAEGRPLSVVFVSHDGRDIARLADRVFVFGDSGIEEHSREEWQDEAALRGIVTALDPAYAMTMIAAGGLDWQLAGLHGPVGRQVGLSIDARDVALSRQCPEGLSVRNLVKAQIVGIEIQSDAPWALVRLQAGELVLCARITRKSVNEMGLTTGQQVFALVKSVALDHLI